jgi:CRP-like cAMP-binding protein
MTTDEARSALRASSIFAGMPADSLCVLSEIVRPERFGPGEAICAAGDSASEIFVVAEGRLVVRLPGRASTVRTLGPGDVFGEYGMFGTRVRTSTVEAVDRVVLLSLDYQRFREFLLAFPEAALRLLETAVGRLVESESERRTV